MQRRQRHDKKSQNAVEYLFDNAWAIVIIVIVALVFYQLGVFQGSNFFGSVCIAQVGFLCQNPTMNTTGYIAADISNGGSLVNITAVGCSNTTSAPPFMPLANTFTLPQNAKQRISFYCLNASSLSLGVKFTGTLWLQYNQGTNKGLIADIAASTQTVTNDNCPNGCVVPLQFATNSSSKTVSAAGANVVVPYNFKYYVCAGSDSGPQGRSFITSTSWFSQAGGIGNWAGIGNQTSNLCSFAVGPQDAVGCGSNTPIAAAIAGYGTTRKVTPVITTTVANSLTFNIGENGAITLIVISAGGTYGVSNVILPSNKCTVDQSLTGAPGSVIATCLPLQSGSYTVSYTTVPNICSGATTGTAYIQSYVFPP